MIGLYTWSVYHFRSLSKWPKDEVVWKNGCYYRHLYPWRIHGAGIYVNINGVYWWDPCHIWQHHGSVMGSVIKHGWEMLGTSPIKKRLFCRLWFAIIVQRRHGTPARRGRRFDGTVVTEPRNEKERQSAVMVGNWRFPIKYDMFNTCSLWQTWYNLIVSWSNHFGIMGGFPSWGKFIGRTDFWALWGLSIAIVDADWCYGGGPWFPTEIMAG